jgi:hypothetical protein
MEVLLTHKGTSYPVSLPAEASVKDLMTICTSKFTDVEPSTMKLVAKGQLLSAAVDQHLASLGIETGAKILLAGAARSDIDSIRKIPSHTHVMDDLNGFAPVRIPEKHYGPTVRYDGTNRYGFGTISVIETFADHAAAFDVLYRVGTHPGVLGVMKRRRWFVPNLSEMYPDGKVGVDPVCVLGLNKNNGQEICLRLRTDDLLGFRKFSIVMKTVWHELAHNEISEHTGKFYDLVSELTSAGDALDWTKSDGHTLGDEHFYKREGVTIATNSRYNSKDSGPTSGVVGGNTIADPGISVRDLAARAATARRLAAPTAEAHIPHLTPVDQSPSNDAKPLAIAAVDEDVPRSMPVVHSILQSGSLEVTNLEATEQLSGVVIDCLTTSHSVKEALTTLHTILSNVLGVLSGEVASTDISKFLKVRPGNPTFVRKTGGSSSAVNFLRCAGFAPDTLVPSVLVFPSHDDAAVSALFNAVHALQEALIEHG